MVLIKMYAYVMTGNWELFNIIKWIVIIIIIISFIRSLNNSTINRNNRSINETPHPP